MSVKLSENDKLVSRKSFTCIIQLINSNRSVSRFAKKCLNTFHVYMFYTLTIYYIFLQTEFISLQFTQSTQFNYNLVFAERERERDDL